MSVLNDFLTIHRTLSSREKKKKDYYDDRYHFSNYRCYHLKYICENMNTLYGKNLSLSCRNGYVRF